MKGHSTSLAHEAARLAWETLDLAPTGFALSMHNAIPFARGLGSSSAAIVGGLFAANEWARAHHSRALSGQELLDLATRLEGHPDNVAPALLGGFCACAMREDGRAFAVKLPVSSAPRWTVWVPEAELLTERARDALPSAYLRRDCVFNLSRAALLVAALATGDFAALSEALRDRVHQDFRAHLVPGWDELGAAAHEAGALGTTLSGAGPSLLFWLAPDAEVSAFTSHIEAAARGHVAGRAMGVEMSEGARVVA